MSFPETDLALFGVVGQPDDLTYYVRMRDAADLDPWTNPNWGPNQTGCLTEDYVLPLTDWNTVVYQHTYTGPIVPQFLEVGVDLWEDESPDQLLGIGCQGTRCAFETGFCCGGVIFGLCAGVIDDDDLHCVNDSYAQLDYRLGSPCEWYNHGPVSGSCANNVYFPRIETFWRYTEGDACATAIDLGNVAPGFTTITHFNSNECYTDQIVYPGGGQDVVYQINVTNPVGLVLDLCGPGTATSDILLLDAGCNIMQTNSGACGSGSQIQTPLCNTGIYFVVMEGRSGSQGTFTLTISEDPNLIVTANAGPDVSVCVGLGVQIGALLPNLPATGGQPGYTYQWSPNTFITNNTDSITTVFPPSTTNYTLSVTDNLGCVSTDQVTVTVNPGPPVALGPDQMVCPGTPVTFDAGAGFSTYFWNTGSFNQTISPSDTGTYIAVVSDLNGCVGRDTVVLQNHPEPALNLGVDTSICIGANLTLTATAGMTNYNWNPAAGNTNAINVNTANTYSVTITDGNSCTNIDTIVVGIDTLPIPMLPAAIQNCPGDPVVLNPGAGWPGYLWNSGNMNQVEITSLPGPYSVTVTDGNGCEGVASTTI
ncbi:MAG: hypothetical protein AAF570_18450, partial [Bacteroidota bacterium]